MEGFWLFGGYLFIFASNIYHTVGTTHLQVNANLHQFKFPKQVNLPSIEPRLPGRPFEQTLPSALSESPFGPRSPSFSETTFTTGSFREPRTSLNDGTPLSVIPSGPSCSLCHAIMDAHCISKYCNLPARTGVSAFETPQPIGPSVISPDQPAFRTGISAFETPQPIGPPVTPPDQPAFRTGFSAFETPQPIGPPVTPPDQPAFRTGFSAFETPQPVGPPVTPPDQPAFQAGVSAFETPQPIGPPVTPPDQPAFRGICALCMAIGNIHCIQNYCRSSGFRGGGQSLTSNAPWARPAILPDCRPNIYNPQCATATAADAAMHIPPGLNYKTQVAPSPDITNICSLCLAAWNWPCIQAYCSHFDIYEFLQRHYGQGAGQSVPARGRFYHFVPVHNINSGFVKSAEY